jgi:hypothetical protein
VFVSFNCSTFFFSQSLSSIVSSHPLILLDSYPLYHPLYRLTLTLTSHLCIAFTSDLHERCDGFAVQRTKLQYVIDDCRNHILFLEGESFTHHSPIIQTSLTHHSPIIHRSLTHHSSITHPSLTSHRSAADRNLFKSVVEDLKRTLARQGQQGASLTHNSHITHA